ncbi:MAG: carboxypeptidase regulatory-like domain-containing protein, partial [Candidatus Aminicenantales bacterium]
MIKKNGKPLCVVFFLLLALIPPLRAIETGEIKGKVVDEKGAPLPGVAITARSPNLQGARTAFSSPEGDFYFPLLPVGRYTLSFRLEGFTPLIKENVIVRLGRVTDVHAVMRLSEIKEEIVVTATPPLIEKIPVQNRNIVDIVKYAPGVTGVRVNTRRGTATQGQPSFRGEGEEGNTWIVDGLAVSGVRLKNSGVPLNFDAIEEIQIISDPFSPEYGSAYGGIINMVTRSGSNDLEGEFALALTNKHLQSRRREQLAIVTEPEYFSNYNWYLNLGGPLIKDKLWFFLSDNFYTNTEQTRDQTLDYFFVPGGTFTTRTNNLFAKLTYALSQNHTLSLTAVHNRSLGQKGGTGIPDLFEDHRFSDTVFRLNYKGILSPSMFIEAGLGVIDRIDRKEPVTGDLGPAQYYVEDLGRNLHNTYGNVTDDQNRLDFSIKLTRHFQTPTLGHHEINLGLEYTSFGSDFGVDFTGDAEDIFPGNGFDSGTKYYFSSWREGDRTPTFFYEYGRFRFLNSARGFGLYMKDKVTLGRFTVMLGFRSQTQRLLDDRDQELWSWGLSDFLAPRFSCSVDLTGDGVNILKLGWGRFSDYITTMPLGLFNSG